MASHGPPPAEVAWSHARRAALASLDDIKAKIPKRPPRDVDWGDVGSLQHLANTLREMADWYTGG